MIKDKELLLKDLCARLPYGVKMNHIANSDNEPTTLIGIVKNMITLEGNGGYSTVNIDEFKPYLFPLSSMTEEQRKEWQSLMIKDNYTGILFYTPESFDYLYKNHIDIRGLIPKGLAIDATGLHIY